MCSLLPAKDYCVAIFVTDRWYATGIVSSGYECARPDSYGLYTNVAEYKKWIIENILMKAD